MAAEKGLILLDYWVSPFGQRVRIALEEKGLEFDYREEDFGNKSELLVKSNPVYKKIPVFIHDGKPVCESLVIMQYIDEVWSDRAPLMPADAYERAQARFWADYIDKKVYDCQKRLWKFKEDAHEEAKRELIEILKNIEGALGDNKYFGGEIFGFVDIAFVPFVSWFYTFETLANLSIEKLAPKLVAWSKRCIEKKSVSKHLSNPHKVYEVLKKLYGVE